MGGAKALEADGFTAPRPAKGSHRAYTKRFGDRTVVVVAVIVKKEIPAGTVRCILTLGGIDEERLNEWFGRQGWLQSATAALRAAPSTVAICAPRR